MSLFNFVFFNSLTNKFVVGFANNVISGVIDGPNRNPPNCTILDN